MTANSLVFGRRAVILVVVLAAAAMFATSFLYRMNHPNLFVQVRPQSPGAGMPPGMGGDANGPMARVKEYMARVDADPDDAEALVGLGNAFLMMSAWDRAITPLVRASRLRPHDTEALKALGIAYFNKKEIDKAADAYRTILGIAPEDTLALFNLGIINKYYFKKTEEARAYFEKVCDLEKHDPDLVRMARQELAQ